MEQLGYIKALDGAPLYCAYHAAAENVTPKGRGFPVVIAPPLFEERKSAYSALRRVAQRLAAAGHAVMRFDYRGSGESGGTAALRRWEHLSQDVATVRKTLARLSGKRDSALLGLRAGATVALLETIRVGGEAVIALAPIVSGATQVRLWRMRSKIKAELTVDAESQKSDVKSQRSTNSDVFDFDGFPVHPGFFEDVAKIDLVKDLGRLSCPGLIAQVSHREDAAPESVRLMETLGSRATLRCIRMEPFWDKIDDVDTAPLEDLALKFLGEV